MRITMRKSVAVLIAVLLSFASTQSGSYAQCLSKEFEPGPVAKTTGDALLDAQFNAEATHLSAVFRVNAKMVLLQDSGGENALASCQKPDPEHDGTVYLGARLIEKELFRMDRGPIAVAAVMAHQWAHILQCALKSQIQGKTRELQADYLAGYYLRRKETSIRDWIGSFARKLYAAGDYREPSYHGTPDERVAAMLEGFSNYTALTIEHAFQDGEKFVSAMRLQ